MRFPLGTQVELKNPLPGDGNAPWKVVGAKLNTAPPLYKLARFAKGKPPRNIQADEGELVLFVAKAPRKI